MITMSLQTKLGEKVAILVDRIVELWDGKPSNKKKGGKNGAVKVSQPISDEKIYCHIFSFQSNTKVRARHANTQS